MLSTSSDLQDTIVKRILDNSRNLITASALRGVLFDVLDTVMEAEKHITVATVEEFLALIDALYIELKVRLGKDPGFNEAFTVKQYRVFIQNDTGLAEELVTPNLNVVTIDLAEHVPLGGTIYLASDKASGNWVATIGLTATLTNPEETPDALGGIPAGTTFNNTPIAEVLNQLLYPYKTPVITLSSTPNAAVTLEVGQALLPVDQPLVLTYTGQYLQNVASAVFTEAGTTISPAVEPNTPYEHTLSSYTAEPNVYLVPTTRSWSVQVTDTNGNVFFGPNLTTRWVHRLFYGWSTASTTVLEDITVTGSSLTRITEIPKPSTATEAYLHLFQPMSQPEYNTFKVGGFDAVMNAVGTTTSTVLGAEVTYRVYTVSNPSFGPFTLVLT